MTRTSDAYSAIDTLQNVVSSLGTEKDKNTFNTYVLNQLSPAQLEIAYRADWVARKGVDIPAADATRKWRSWKASQEQIQKIESEEKRLGLQRKTKQVMQRARLYGGAGLLIGVGDKFPDQPLDVEKIGQGGLKYLTVLSRHELRCGELDRDPLSPYYGEPIHYEVSSVGQPSVKVHPSRVSRFLGAELPSLNLTADGGWGDSVLQAVDDAVKDVSMVSASLAALVNEAKTDVVKVPNLMENVSQDEYRQRLLTRFTLANIAKSNVNTLLLDGEETWERITTDFSHLPETVLLYVLLASGALDIPATRFIGQSAQGLNATGEGDVRNYYDRLSSEHNNDVTPALSRVDAVLLRSALGATRDNVWYEWNPLWQSSEVEKSTVAVNKATVFKTDLDAGLLSDEGLVKMRRNQLIEDGTYPGLEQIIMDEDDAAESDETDPEVQAQFAMSSGRSPDGSARVTAAVSGGPDGGSGVQKLALNGTQIESMLSIANSVAAKELPKETGLAVLRIAFPLQTEAELAAVLDPLDDFEGHEKESPPALAAANANVRPGALPAAFRRSVDALRSGVLDAGRPRSLYVRRQVLNAAEIVAWARSQGFEHPMAASAMHVTIMYCKQSVDWMRMGTPWEAELKLPAGGPRLVERLGDGGAVCLLFASDELKYRHQRMRDEGCSYDYDEYQPHVTITWRAPADMDLDGVEPYQGPIRLGPEIFEEIKKEFDPTTVGHDARVRDYNENHDPDSGMFSSEGGGGSGSVRSAGAAGTASTYVRSPAVKALMSRVFTASNVRSAVTVALQTTVSQITNVDNSSVMDDLISAKVASLADDLGVTRAIAREHMLRAVKAVRRLRAGATVDAPGPEDEDEVDKAFRELEEALERYEPDEEDESD